MRDEYKVKVIRAIIEKGDSCGFYGALKSRAGEVKTINIDKEALRILLEYYMGEG